MNILLIMTSFVRLLYYIFLYYQRLYVVKFLNSTTVLHATESSITLTTWVPGQFIYPVRQTILSVDFQSVVCGSHMHQMCQRKTMIFDFSHSELTNSVKVSNALMVSLVLPMFMGSGNHLTSGDPLARLPGLNIQKNWENN